MRLLVGKYNLKEDKGSVLMEAIICLPVLLLLSLGVAQFAHIWYCRTIVHYAAFSAARAAVTAPNDAVQQQAQARRAAEIVCAPIVFTNPLNGTDFALPGITPSAPDSAFQDPIPGSGSINNGNTTILRVSVTETSLHNVRANVEFGVPLLFPLAGPVIGKTMALFNGGSYSPSAGDGSGGIYQLVAAGDYPRIILKEQVYMAKPFLSTWTTP